MAKLNGPAAGTMLTEITPLILTYNESPNLRRVLDKLQWAHQIVVVDSGSSDETLEIAASFAQVHVIHRTFDTFANQCNFGLDQVTSPWVLSMDADYVLRAEFVQELDVLTPPPDVCGYRAAFRYCIGGHPLRGTLYPPRTVLYRRERARYRDEGHGHRVHIDGRVLSLHSRIFHDDRKPLNRWLDSQRKYAEMEAREFIERPNERSSMADRLRSWIWPAAPAALCYTLLVKGCLLDGWPGWCYALQRTYAEILLSLHLLEYRLGSGGKANRSGESVRTYIGKPGSRREGDTDALMHGPKDH